MRRKLNAFSLLLSFILSAQILATSPKTDFAALEQRARSLDGKARHVALERLASEYVRSHRLQEAAWTLREIGETSKADALVARIKRQLAYDDVLDASEHLPSMYFKPIHMYLKNGISGVYKAFHRHRFPDPRLEVLAYALDEILALGIVPVTVLRNDRKYSGSVQYYVEDAQLGAKGVQGAPGKFEHGVARMGMLDILIDNYDRHGNNWLLRPGGHPVAVDHAQRAPSADPLPIQASRRIRLELLPYRDALKHLDRKTLDDKVGHLISSDEIEAILARRDLLVDWLERTNVSSVFLGGIVRHV